MSPRIKFWIYSLLVKNERDIISQCSTNVGWVKTIKPFSNGIDNFFIIHPNLYYYWPQTITLTAIDYSLSWIELDAHILSPSKFNRWPLIASETYLILRKTVLPTALLRGLEAMFYALGNYLHWADRTLQDYLTQGQSSLWPEEFN